MFLDPVGPVLFVRLCFVCGKPSIIDANGHQKHYSRRHSGNAIPAGAAVPTLFKPLGQPMLHGLASSKADPCGEFALFRHSYPASVTLLKMLLESCDLNRFESTKHKLLQEVFVF